MKRTKKNKPECRKNNVKEVKTLLHWSANKDKMLSAFYSLGVSFLFEVGTILPEFAYEWTKSNTKAWASLKLFILQSR
jgi:hypothetical protein